MKKILFQGDSITDAGRGYDNINQLGYGYPQYVAAELGCDNPGKYEFINRGISGNRIINLLARVKCDMINLKPDYMSILIGVNDVWHELENQNGISTEKFEIYYDMLIKEVKEALPDIKFMILEPFVLKGSATEEKWEDFRKDVEEKAAAAKRIADKHNIVFVPLLEKFDEAEKSAPADFWTIDGVHPKAAGHELIKKEWLKAFEKIK